MDPKAESKNDSMIGHMDRTLDSLDKANLPNQIREIAKYLVSGWKDCNSEDIEVKGVAGGMTNYLYSASMPSSSHGPRTVLLRIYGNKTEKLIDREREIQNISRFSSTGFGPKLYGTFCNGYVYEYYEGRPVPPKELYEGKWNSRLGTELAKWHKQPLRAGEESPGVWTTIEGWLAIVPASYGSAEKDRKLQETGGLEKLRAELALLKNICSKLNSPAVFSHNDLLGGNIIVNDKSDVIKFIDFEYAGTNYQAFDIANHFNEWAGFEADYTRYPTKEVQYEFYKTYLREWNGVQPTEKELHKLYVQVNKFALVSHFFWGTWALVQESISTIDFDFVGYAGLRFKEYFNKKEEFLSL